jgi:hypothetical protein
MQARFALQWLAGKIDASPLWNGAPQKPHMTDGAEYPYTRAEIDEVYSWALLAEIRYPLAEGAVGAVRKHLLDHGAVAGCPRPGPG